MRTAKVVHDWSDDEMTLTSESAQITVPTTQGEVPRESRPGDIEVSEFDEFLKKLQDSSIIPSTTLDLNWWLVN